MNEFDQLTRLALDDARPDPAARQAARAALLAEIERAELVPAASANAGRRGGGHSLTRRHRFRLRFAPAPALAVLGCVLVAAIVGAAVLLAGGHDARRPAPPRPAGNLPARVQPLARLLAPLRRPQTPADAPAAVLRDLGPRGPGDPTSYIEGPVDTAMIRLATTLADGQRVYLVPRRIPTGAALRHVPAAQRAAVLRDIAARDGQDVLSLYAGGSDCCATAARFRTAGDELGYSTPTAGTLLVAVPDGVAKVGYIEPAQDPNGNQASLPGAKPLPQRTVYATVHDNIAVFNGRRAANSSTGNMMWYSATGQVIRRVGNPNALTRLPRPVRPAPATALSRRAQRNPATPNPITVTPTVLGRRSAYTVRFHELLNGASYGITTTGPGGPDCARTVTTGGDGVLGSPDDVNGQEFHEPVQPATGDLQRIGWCPGTYTVRVYAASVTGHPRGQRFPAFGEAHFTVR